MDRLEEWRLFLGVARLGSFARTAEQHRCSPQAVTRAIASLEQRIGSKLLHRTTRSVSLTDAGARNVDQARRVLAELDALEAQPNADAPLRGVLSVTAPVLFGQIHVVPLVARFLAEHPAVDARLLLADHVMSLVDEGVDMAVRIGALPDSSLRRSRVGDVRSVMCASPAYLRRHGTPRNAKALSKHACIAFTGTTPIADSWTFGDGRERVTVHPRLVVNTGQAAIDAALAGLGLVRVLSYQLVELARAKKLAIVLEAFEPPPAPVHLVWPSTTSRTAEAFREVAARELRMRLAAPAKPDRRHGV